MQQDDFIPTSSQPFKQTHSSSSPLVSITCLYQSKNFFQWTMTGIIHIHINKPIAFLHLAGAGGNDIDAAPTAQLPTPFRFFEIRIATSSSLIETSNHWSLVVHSVSAALRKLHMYAVFYVQRPKGGSINVTNFDLFLPYHNTTICTRKAPMTG